MVIYVAAVRIITDSNGGFIVNPTKKQVSK